MSEVHERQAETGALVTVRSALPTILAADTNDILGKLKSELDGFAGDATTERGRKEIASKAHKVSVAKQDLLRLAGTLKEGHRKVLNGIIAEEKLIVGQMDPLRDAVRKPLDDYEAIEAARVDAHRAALVEVEGWSSIPDDWTATQIADRIEELRAHPHLSREWQEFKDRAGAAAKNSYNALVAARVAAQEREVEAARLAEEERARAEAEALRLAQEEQARIERARAEAAAEATRVAEAAAAEQARKVEEAAQREREAAEAERLRVVREAAEAEAAAKERERVQAEAMAVAEARRVAGHRGAIAGIQGSGGYSGTSAEFGMRLDWLLSQSAANFEEFADEAAAVLAAEVERTRTLLTAARTREDEAEARRAAEAEAAQQRREDAAANAARETERRRQEAEAARTREEAADRERNVAHRRKINREARDAIAKVLANLPPDSGIESDVSAAQAIVEALAKGQIPHCKMEY